MRRVLLLCAGWALLALGAVGLVVPVLPTTPFVIVAAGCFSGSSPRVYERLTRSRFFGPYIENFRTKQGVPVRVKVQGIVMLWTLLGISMAAMGKPTMTCVLLAVGVAVTAHLLLLKTNRQDTGAALAEEQEG